MHDFTKMKLAIGMRLQADVSDNKLPEIEFFMLDNEHEIRPGQKPEDVKGKVMARMAVPESETDAGYLTLYAPDGDKIARFSTLQMMPDGFLDKAKQFNEVWTGSPLTTLFIFVLEQAGATSRLLHTAKDLAKDTGVPLARAISVVFKHDRSLGGAMYGSQPGGAIEHFHGQPTDKGESSFH